ncbi:MAG TPA: hypothetical protein VK501_12255 [Baekduia sp.]|uniref:hypothetical protein n=1 Tax=Baekduia sp. TaxID=2600305 RepID=UPI002BC50676|nr:hypothetical protein [Baekduia sp.]HMJ34680.1 hypothetical protein [Baekduia sp.]
MKHTALLIVLAVALAIPVAGCGSSDDNSQQKQQAIAAAQAAAVAAANNQRLANTKPTGAQLSRPAYIRKADNMCRRMLDIRKRTASAFRQALEANQVLSAADVLDQSTPAYSAWLTQLHALRRPKSDDKSEAKTLGLWFAVLDNQSQATVAQAQALRNYSPDALAEIRKARRQGLKDSTRLAKRYGLRVCGRAVQTATT